MDQDDSVFDFVFPPPRNDGDPVAEEEEKEEEDVFSLGNFNTATDDADADSIFDMPIQLPPQPPPPPPTNDDRDAMEWDLAETNDICKKEILSNAIRLTLNENLAKLIASPSHVMRMERMLGYTREVEAKLLANLEHSSAGELTSSAVCSNAPPEEVISLHATKLFAASYDAMLKIDELGEVNISNIRVKDVPTFRYQSVSDHFRECIPGVLDTGFLTPTDPGYKTFADQRSNAIEQPCCGGKKCWAYVNFGIVLRKGRNKYCELCHWYLVNLRRRLDATRSTPIRYIYQLHKFEVNGPPPSFSSEAMECTNSDVGFDGVIDPFPRIDSSMFTPITITKNILVNATTREFRQFQVRGLRLASWMLTPESHPQVDDIKMNDDPFYSCLRRLLRREINIWGAHNPLDIDRALNALEYFVVRCDSHHTLPQEYSHVEKILAVHEMKIPLALGYLFCEPRDDGAEMIMRKFWCPRYMDLAILRSCLTWFYVRVNIILLLLTTRETLLNDEKALLFGMLHGAASTMVEIEKILLCQTRVDWRVSSGRFMIMQLVDEYKRSFSISEFTRVLPQVSQVQNSDTDYFFSSQSREEIIAKYILFPLDDKNCPGFAALPEFEEAAAGVRDEFSSTRDEWRSVLNTCLNAHSQSPRVFNSTFRLRMFLDHVKTNRVLTESELWARYPRDNSHEIFRRGLFKCMSSSRVCQALMNNANDIGDKLQIFEEKKKKEDFVADELDVFDDDDDDDDDENEITQETKIVPNSKKKMRIKTLMKRSPTQIREIIFTLAISNIFRKDCFTAIIGSLIQKHLSIDPEFHATIGKLVKEFVMQGPRDLVVHYYKQKSREKTQISKELIFIVLQTHLANWINESFGPSISDTFLATFARDATRVGNVVRDALLRAKKIPELETIRRAKKKTPLACRLNVVMENKRVEEFVFRCIFGIHLPNPNEMDFLDSESIMMEKYGADWKPKMKHLSSMRPFAPENNEVLNILRNVWKMTPGGIACLKNIIRKDWRAMKCRWNCSSSIPSSALAVFWDSKSDRTLLYYLLFYTLRFGGCVELHPLPLQDAVYNILSNRMGTRECHGIGICPCCSVDPNAIEKYSHDRNAQPHPRFAGTPDGVCECTKKHTSSKLHLKYRLFGENDASHGKFIHKYMHFAKKPELAKFITTRLFSSKLDFETCGRQILGNELFRTINGTSTVSWECVTLQPLLEIVTKKQSAAILSKFPLPPSNVATTAATTLGNQAKTRDQAIKEFEKRLSQWPEWRNFIKKMCRWVYDSIHANDREVTIVNTIPFITTTRTFKSQHIITRKFRYCPCCRTIKLLAEKNDGTPWGYMCATCQHLERKND